MQEFYQGIHRILGTLLYAENIYIALYDDERKQINFAYYADSVDTDWPDPRAWEPIGEGFGGGSTGYILRTGQVLHATAAQLEEMSRAGILQAVGALAVDYMGVPLVSEGRSVGVLAVQSYVEGISYDQEDERLLAFVAQHIADALERTRGAAEIRQRNAELALINDVGEALSKQLDFQTIIDIVGERIRAIFEVDNGAIVLYDPATNEITLPYSIDRGGRTLGFAPRQLGPGLSSEVIRTRRPLRLNSNAEAESHDVLVVGDDTEVMESWLGVPILAADRVLGVVSLERAPKYGFTDSDERLLSTLAQSMGVALENARLFDETKRLLAETEQRSAELAVINDVGEALAKQLDFQAIVDLIGERMAAMLKSQDIFIAMYDRVAQQISFPFELDQGRRVHGDPIPFGAGLTSEVIRTGRTLRLGTSEEQAAYSAIIGTFAEGDVGTAGASWLGVPIMSGDEPIGVVAFSAMPEHAFSEADERLVSTIVTNMGVALENARLFEQTNTLLTETNERAAELALVNSVQQGLAGRLEMQAMYDLVGDKIQEIFDAQVVDIGILDRDAGILHFPYTIERGVRFPDEPMEVIGFRRMVVRVEGAAPRQPRCRAPRDRGRASPRSSRASHRRRPLRPARRAAARYPASSRSRTSITRTPSPTATSGCSPRLLAA